MTAEQFAYWLNGFVELNGGMPTEAQWKSIREHLAEVFKKVTPPVLPYVGPLGPPPASPGPLSPFQPPHIMPQQWPVPVATLC